MSSDGPATVMLGIPVFVTMGFVQFSLKILTLVCSHHPVINRSVAQSAQTFVIVLDNYLYQIKLNNQKL